MAPPAPQLKPKGLGMQVMLWADTEGTPLNILAARAGEDREKLINKFREDQKAGGFDTTHVAVLVFDGLPPRPEYKPDAPAKKRK